MVSFVDQSAGFRQVNFEPFQNERLAATPSTHKHYAFQIFIPTGYTVSHGGEAECCHGVSISGSQLGPRLVYASVYFLPGE